MTQPSAIPASATQETLSTPATEVAGAVAQPPSSHATTLPSSGWQGTSAGTPGIGDALQVAGGLVLIVVLIFGLGLLVKRLGGGHVRRNGQRVLKTIDSQMVGSKERITVMEIEDTWLVVGITPQGISPLHTLKRPETADVDKPLEARQGMPFAQALREAARQTLGRRKPTPTHDGQRTVQPRDDRNDNDHV